MTYAKGTEVSIEKSRMEIERLLNTNHADAVSVGYSSDKAVIQWTAHKRVIRFVLPLPADTDEMFKYKTRRQRGRTIRGDVRSPEEKKRACEQRRKELWRALFISIKAKIESVKAGISVFDQEFFANIVDPGTGKTVYEALGQQLRLSYEGSPQELKLLESDK